MLKMTKMIVAKFRIIFPLALALLSFVAKAQYSQTIRGKVAEQVLNQPLAGATVAIPGINKSTATNESGDFRFTDVPIGSYQLTISYSGYKNVTLENVIVNSGKELVLNISLEADIQYQKAVEVTAKSKKFKPLNEMSMVSARAFTVEETQKFAAAVNDPLRMATSFAGVISADDGNNDIVIRGNSPTGLLWRMEGVDIPNPNHFSNAGSSGGGISILSAQLLDNSDFVTGAFSAEYGNALSGVFDLKLRKGNNEKREYTAQAGILGLNLAAEGPIMPFYKGSYLVNYRYSTLQLLDKLGIDVAGSGATNFQDLSFNIYLPTSKKGEFTLFGFTGLSDQKNENERDSSKWESEGDRYGGTFTANTTAVGATHTISVGENSQLKSAVSFSHTNNDYNENYTQADGSFLNSYRNRYQTQKWIASTTFNHRFSNRSNMRTGVIFNNIAYDYFNKSWEHPGGPIVERINSSNSTQTLQAFAQWQYRASPKLTMQGGFHYLQLFLNNSYAVEPRASVKYDLDNKNAITFGYGSHSQLQAMGVYFARTTNGEGTSYPNKDLSFTKARHYVLSYGHSFNRATRIKAELYYQQLFDVPVSIYDSLTFSTLNIRGDYVTEPLANAGKGRNYGIDLSFEKNLTSNFYLIVNQSFYQSRYTALDGVERDTRFNGKFAGNVTGGREWSLSNKRSLGVNVKAVYAGGFRTTPVNVEESAAKGYTVYHEKDAFTLQNPDYFRTDLRVSLKWNRKYLTSTLSLDIQNVTNRQNLYGQYFDPLKGKVENSYQTGLIPVINYKVEF
jgi:hypothetical protein